MKYLGQRSVSSFIKITLTILWWLGITGMAAFTLGTLFFIFNGPPKSVSPPPLMLNADFVRIHFLEATVKDPGALFKVFMPFGAVMMSLGLAIIFQLKKIFATLAAGSPFVLENAKRMQRIAIIIFSSAMVQIIAARVIGHVVINNVMVKGVAFTVSGKPNLGALFFGLVILVLAEIFRQGALLKDEQDLTI